MSKKKAIVIPQAKLGNPSGAWFEIRGLKLKSIENITLDQKDGDPMYITALFAVDNCWMKTPF